jgi:hypothetical protein
MTVSVYFIKAEAAVRFLFQNGHSLLSLYLLLHVYVLFFVIIELVLEE